MSTYNPITVSAANVDLTQRYAYSTAVVGSPAAGSITEIATVTIPFSAQPILGVQIHGWCAFTAGTSAISALLGIRQTSTSGTLIASSGAVTVVATDLYAQSTIGFDTAPPAAGVYMLCLTMGSGAATSTVSKVFFSVLVV